MSTEQNGMYQPNNREKSKHANKKKFWCDHCDYDLVGHLGKCPKCGKKNSKKLKE